MALVKKGNRELTIEEHKVEQFIASGYDLIDDTGAILKKGSPVSLSDFKNAYLNAKKEIKEKDKKIEAIDEKIIQLEVELEQKNTTIEDLEKQIEDLNKVSGKAVSKKVASK